MEQYLKKQKRQDVLDYMRVPLDWGNQHKEFLIYNHITEKFSRIFYTNKYREDYLDVEKTLENLENKLIEFEEGLTDIGIYSTAGEYREVKEQIEFIKKYNSSIKN